MTTESKITHCSFAASFTRTAGSTDEGVDVIASTSAVDGHGTIIEQKWDLTRYRSNPVVCLEHATSGGIFGGEPTLPIGRAENVRVESGKLQARIRFASKEANPVADQVRNLVAEGCINAVSVGFLPKTIRTERRDGEDVLVLSDNVLFEISLVSVPSNPEALIARNLRSISKIHSAGVGSRMAPRGGDDPNAPLRARALELQKERALLGQPIAFSRALELAGKEFTAPQPQPYWKHPDEIARENAWRQNPNEHLHKRAAEIAKAEADKGTPIKPSVALKRAARELTGRDA